MRLVAWLKSTLLPKIDAQDHKTVYELIYRLQTQWIKTSFYYCQERVVFFKCSNDFKLLDCEFILKSVPQLLIAKCWAKVKTKMKSRGKKLLQKI